MTKFFILLCLLALVSCHSRKEQKSTKLSSDTFVCSDDLQKPKGKSFQVSDVKKPDALLQTDTSKNIFESKIGKEILFFPEEQQKYPLVNCPNNGLIQTLQECYDNHRPLALSPDIIWLAICQGVSRHINEKYDSLKNIIFIKDKPSKIEIRNDSLEFSAKQWKSLFASFSEETKKYTKNDYYSFFVPQFSTTTDVIKTAYQITLLESYKKAFEYIGDTGCGIPSITITGEKSDWQAILAKLDNLNKLGLSNWAQNLKPIITEFINVFDGNVNKGFWQSIYKSASEYNAFYISGWVIKFFPYIKELERNGVYDEKRGETRVGEIFIPNEFLDGNKYLLSRLSTDNFPSGIAKINVTWNNYFKNVKKEMEVYAGFFAIKQYKDMTLEPFITWVVCEKNSKKPDHILHESQELKLKHTPDYWSPHICKKPVDLAIYDIKRFKNQKTSIDFIRQRLLDSLSTIKQLKNIDLSKDTLEFVVFCNGSIGEIKLLSENPDKQLSDYLTKQLMELPENWFPALAHPLDVLMLMDDFTEKQNKVKVRVNSLVKIAISESKPKD